MPRGSRRPSDVFRAVLKNAEDELALETRKATNFQHTGIRGDERSAALISFLQHHLPASLGVGKGEAIDFHDRRSGQLDIVVYDKSASAPVFSGHDNLLIPCEALYAVIEVKTTLTQDELNRAYSAAANIRKLKPFKHNFIGPRRDGAAIQRNNCRCVYSIFAYDTNLSNDDWLSKEFSRIRKAAEEKRTALDAVERVIVLGRGMINPCNGHGKDQQEDDEGIFLEYYLHLVNFLSRERTRRPPVDWQMYSHRTASGWRAIRQ